MFWAFYSLYFFDVSKLYIRFTNPFFIRANDISKENKRSKVMVQDVYQALKEVGFDNYNIQLEEFMKNHNQEKEDKREMKNIQAHNASK